MSKFKDIFKVVVPVASAVAKPLIPGIAGTALDAVTEQLSKGGASDASKASIQQLAKDNDEQTHAILALHERQLKTESDIAEIKRHLGIS